MKDGPPEHDGSREEAEMFDLVPRFGVEGEFVGGRDMPADEGDVEGEPRGDGMEEEMGERAGEFAAEQWCEDILKERARQTAEERNLRRA